MEMIAKVPVMMVQGRKAVCDGGACRLMSKDESARSHLVASMLSDLQPTDLCCTTAWFLKITGGGALGHPKVYINLDQPGPRSCGYCGLRFEQDPHHHGAHAAH